MNKKKRLSGMKFRMKEKGRKQNQKRKERKENDE